MQVPLLQQQQQQEQQQQQRRVAYLYVSRESLYEETNGNNSNNINNKEQNGDNGSMDEECDEYNMINEEDSGDGEDNDDDHGPLLSLDQIAVEMHVSVDDLFHALQNSSANSSNDSRADYYPCWSLAVSESINHSGSEVSDPNSISSNSSGRKKSSSRERRNGSSNNNSSTLDDNDDDGGGGEEEEEEALMSTHRHSSREAVGRTPLLRFSLESAGTTPPVATTMEGRVNREIEEHLQEAMGTDEYRGPILFYASSNSGNASHLTHYSLSDSSFTRSLNTIPPPLPLSSGSSAVVLVSTGSTSSPSPARTPTPPAMERTPSSLPNPAKRRIRFGSRIVSSVSVYTVDSEVYLGLHFRQHWSSWAALLCGFILESLFEVHLKWFANIGGATTTATIPIAHWVYTYRVILSIVYSLAWLPCYRRRLMMNANSNSNNNDRNFLNGNRFRRGLRSFCMKKLSMTFLSSLCYSLATATMVLSNEMSGSSLFFTATIMHSAWILLYRVARRQMVFFIECCGVFLLILGNVLCNIDSTRAMGLRETLYGNIIMTGGSILFAAAFLLMAFGLQHQLCTTVSITVAVGVELFLITLIMGVCYGYPMISTSSSTSTGGKDDSMNAGFLRANALHAFLLGVEDLLFSLMYLYALFHLDVLSVSACFSLKVAIVPIVAHFVVWQHAAVVPPVVQLRWGPLLFTGVAVVATAAAAVMYFASVRRRFVARRLFHLRGLRPVPDPYRKKARTRQQRQRQQLQQQRYTPLPSSESMAGVR
ncbi:uncharacterized protein TM35_000302330 [Trypanosoma theileri]|uniref:Transmembrane protein n=1 Tax=Trypanosoma theileri TaxID=67003 RepID=A0A1X0NNX1_9TRYP|nr:uncharacterized protein TM35_000302330 [Trypanosoma theileri]ORC86193.1 hypothetical protein TM35_000302330 [Trypanosoma theileri]